MPLVRIDTNKAFDAKEGQDLCEKVSHLVAEVMGKPEKFVQVVLHAGTGDHVVVLHGGTPGPGAFVDVRGIGGFSPKVNGALSKRICGLLTGAGIDATRVYLNFTDVAASSWGHDGATFG
jgi:phenylpyruvate tautomerase PptA (4-oxalocrotonate tautomerase family)